MLVAQGCTLRSEPCAAVEAWLPSSFGCRGRQSRGSGPVFLLNEQFIYKHTQFNCLSLVLGSLPPVPCPIPPQEGIIPSPFRESGSGGSTPPSPLPPYL